MPIRVDNKETRGLHSFGCENLHVMIQCPREVSIIGNQTPLARSKICIEPKVFIFAQYDILEKTTFKLLQRYVVNGMTGSLGLITSPELRG